MYLEPQIHPIVCFGVVTPSVRGPLVCPGQENHYTREQKKQNLKGRLRRGIHFPGTDICAVDATHAENINK